MRLSGQILGIFLALLFITASGCSLKSARKNLSDIAIGDDKQIVTERWGKPDRVLPSKGPWGERKLWTYNCAQFSDCDSNCIYLTPCYYVCFENDSIVSVYDAVNC